MSEEPMPVIPTDQSATQSLIRHWGAQGDRHVRLIIATDSALAADDRFAGTAITSPPPVPNDLLPTLLMQTLVTPGNRTDEGLIIQAVTIPWREILKLIDGDPNLIYQIDPRKWEEIIAGSYRASGLFDEVVLTPRSGDHGRDVIATKNGFCSIRCIESVKRYTPGRVVEADDVRSLGFAMLADPKVNKGIISTTWEFAPRILNDPNIESFVPHRLELLNRDKLLQRLTVWHKSL